MTDRHRPTTVLMTADCVGGVWSYAAGLCASLPEICFVLATMGPRARPVQRGDITRLDNVVLAESGYRLEWMGDAGKDFEASCDWLVGLAERHNVDLVHVNGYAHAGLAIDRPVLVAAHSDVLSWWAAVHQCSAPQQWDYYRKRVVAGLASATRVVAPTAAVLHNLEQQYRPVGNAEIIANGINPAAFCPSFKQPVVFAAGRIWDAAKNLVALDEVAPRLAWPVEIAGDAGHPESGAANLANVRLLGRLGPAEMARQLGKASIFAAPALYEPFGLTILEAAAAGCALVLGDIPSLRENWDGAAVFVAPQDRPALGSAINRLIANAGDRIRLAMAARCRARHLTLDRMARAYAALYCGMVRGSVRLETA